jgi:hypothetical protein
MRFGNAYYVIVYVPVNDNIIKYFCPKKGRFPAIREFGLPWLGVGSTQGGHGLLHGQRGTVLKDYPAPFEILPLFERQ